MDSGEPLAPTPGASRRVQVMDSGEPLAPTPGASRRVQVMDSGEPLAPTPGASRRVQVMDSGEPLAPTPGASRRVQVMDSGEPLAPTPGASRRVQVMDSGEPLAPTPGASRRVQVMDSGEPLAPTPGASRRVQVIDSGEPLAPTPASSGLAGPLDLDITGNMANMATLRMHIDAAFFNTVMDLQQQSLIMLAAMEESDDEDESAVLVQAISNFKEPAVRVKEYLEKTVAGYTEKQFQSHFRLTWENYELLEHMIATFLNKENTEFIPARKQLLCILWLLATPDSFRSVGDRFDLPKSSVYNCFLAVIKALNNIAGSVIKWPNQEEKINIKDGFRKFANMHDCVGAVDGTFVEIKAPKEHAQVYICRKCFHAIQLQVIAIPSLKFTDVFTGYPGSVGDRRVFTNSYIYKNISNSERTFFDDGEYILGDKAYPVLSWCIPPYINRGVLSVTQTNFNTRHAQTRQVVERAFSLLFGRYRRLKYLDMNVVENIPNTILACCVLHNLCLENGNEELEAEAIADGQNFFRERNQRPGEEENYDGERVLRHGDGHRFRDALANRLMQRHV